MIKLGLSIDDTEEPVTQDEDIPDLEGEGESNEMEKVD